MFVLPIYLYNCKSIRSPCSNVAQANVGLWVNFVSILRDNTKTERNRLNYSLLRSTGQRESVIVRVIMGILYCISGWTKSLAVAV